MFAGYQAKPGKSASAVGSKFTGRRLPVNFLQHGAHVCTYHIACCAIFPYTAAAEAYKSKIVVSGQLRYAGPMETRCKGLCEQIC